MQQSASPINQKPTIAIKMIHKACTVPDCGVRQKYLIRGWCSRHYNAWRNHGDPLEVKRIYNNPPKRFWSYVLKTPGCWVWQGVLDTKGYGQFSINQKIIRAHRYSFSLSGGVLVKGLVIDHKCSNTRCVNPNHLEQVTQKENIKRGCSPIARFIK